MYLTYMGGKTSPGLDALIRQPWILGHRCSVMSNFVTLLLSGFPALIVGIVLGPAVGPS